MIQTLLRNPLLLCLVACSTPQAEHATIPQDGFEIKAGKPVAGLEGEVHLRNVRQLTFGGENAEAYFSFDGKQLVMQARRGSSPCDQIYTLDLETGEERMVSAGIGRTTCSYFSRDDKSILYATTHLDSPDCPQSPPVVGGNYVWPIFSGYDIVRANPDGSGIQKLTDTPGYDAEATVNPVNGRIIFTSTRDGDLELYSMEADGSDVTRITNRIGYDGGAFYSHDGSKLVLRSGFPEDAAAEKSYLDLLAKGLVMPTHMELTTCNADGSDFKRVTHNGKANFAPFWHPDNERIIFSSNKDDARGRNFDLYMINADGSGMKKITNNPSFDSFPMFSPDGRYLVFASNRYSTGEGDTNVFVAEWVEEPEG